ncbi:hypothetical protein PSS61_24475, partial [Enterobacter hormaechei subsp. xiangfangensis]|uniref:hypothetical protein n=1 Tax=Enterobacter hormaechei TaxID=158836 RepID=UPI00287573FE
EWVHVQLHQQKGMISLSPPTICNSAGQRKSILADSLPLREGHRCRIERPVALLFNNLSDNLCGHSK